MDYIKRLVINILRIDNVYRDLRKGKLKFCLLVSNSTKVTKRSSRGAFPIQIMSALPFKKLELNYCKENFLPTEYKKTNFTMIIKGNIGEELAIKKFNGGCNISRLRIHLIVGNTRNIKRKLEIGIGSTFETFNQNGNYLLVFS